MLCSTQAHKYPIGITPSGVGRLTLTTGAKRGNIRRAPSAQRASRGGPGLCDIRLCLVRRRSRASTSQEGAAGPQWTNAAHRDWRNTRWRRESHGEPRNRTVSGAPEPSRGILKDRDSDAYERQQEARDGQNASGERPDWTLLHLQRAVKSSWGHLRH
ncbi:hypothetical protein NDU88_001833 [Pleurodeles waltl]|uniref:Uncharacterized protein n=1 Tax=Pleurodeles waltl TaxID=8319 RepID=A0AAV7T0V0_PLEWA|nr:hypothetical protein NDU88_001833 [Pleurodeles waltl]